MKRKKLMNINLGVMNFSVLDIYVVFLFIKVYLESPTDEARPNLELIFFLAPI